MAMADFDDDRIGCCERLVNATVCDDVGADVDDGENEKNGAIVDVVVVVSVVAFVSFVFAFDFALAFAFGTLATPPAARVAVIVVLLVWLDRFVVVKLKCDCPILASNKL